MSQYPPSLENVPLSYYTVTDPGGFKIPSGQNGIWFGINIFLGPIEAALQILQSVNWAYLAPGTAEVKLNPDFP